MRATSMRHWSATISAVAVAVAMASPAAAATQPGQDGSAPEPDAVVPQAPEPALEPETTAPPSEPATPETQPLPPAPAPLPAGPAPQAATAGVDSGATCASPSLRRTPGCAEYRKWTAISYVGWPTMIVGWSFAAAISGAALQRDNKLGSLGLIPVVGAPISAAAGDWSLGARLGLAATGAFQITGLVLGIVGAVKARRAATPRVSASPIGLTLRF